jgi:ABC-type transport system involved in multi-copper enzyme maturation permease subunit
MTFLPIVVRELRVASRRKRTYSIRFRTAFMAVVLGAVLLPALGAIKLGSGSGLVMFQTLAFFCFFYCLALAGNTADCISEEKREGTLGLLFLTDLSGWDVALGKLCANSLQSCYAVLGTFPVVAIVLLLGGVSAGQFCKVALALLNVFFFAHCAGLLASVLSRALSKAHAITGALLVGFLAGPPLLGLAISRGSFAGLAPVLSALSPGYALFQIMGLRTYRFYWTSLLLVHLTAWLFLALASRRLPHCWQEKADPAGLRWRERFRQWTYGPPRFREDLRRRLIGINPFLWLVSRNRLAPIFVWGTLAIVACFTIWVVYRVGLSECIPVFVGAVCVGHLLLIAGVASEASRHLEEQRRSGALEFVLCSTPLRDREILAGLWSDLRRQFLLPFIVVLVSDVVMAFVSNNRSLRMWHVDRDRIAFDWFISTAMVLLVVDTIAAGWVGMWRAMANRRPRRSAAAGETLGFLIFAPMLLLYFLGVISELIFPHLYGWPLHSDALFWCYVVLALLMPVGLSFFARRQLLTQFREMAAAQTSEPMGILGQLGRLLGRAARRKRRPVVISSSRP